MSKTNAKSLRNSDGMELTQRFAKRQPTLRMQSGGDLWQQRTDLQNAQTGANSIVQGASQQAAAAEVKRLTNPNVQVPTGPGMDRAGFLARNPNVQQGGAGTSRPGEPNISNAPYPERANATRYPAPTGMPSPMTPPAAGPGVPMVGNTSVFQHGSNTFSDSATAPSWGKNTGKPSAQNMALMDGVIARRSPQAPAGWSGQNLGFTSSGPTGVLPMNNFAAPQSFPTADAAKAAGQDVLGLRNGGDLRMAAGGTYEDGIGGQVPGKGKGDKFKALYEPKEVVVSNYDLEKTPGLREGLRDLRAEGLHERGMTPEQADAKAMGGGKGLRAMRGFDDDSLAVARDARTGYPVQPSGVRLPPELPHGVDLNLRNNNGFQPMPRASIEADKIAAERQAGRFNASRGAANSASARPGAVTGGPAPLPPKGPNFTTVSAEADRLNESGLKFRAGQAQAAADYAEQAKRPMSWTDTPRTAAPKPVLSPGALASEQVAKEMAVEVNSPQPKGPQPRGPQSILKATDPFGKATKAAEAANATFKGQALRVTGAVLNNPVTRFVASAPVAVATAGMTPAELAPGTLTQAHIDALNRPWDPNMKPIDVSNPVSVSQRDQYAAQPPKLTIAGDATMPGQDPNRPQLREQAPAIDWAARKAERDALTQRDSALGDRMESSRMARESAGYAAQAQPQVLGSQWEREKNAWNAKMDRSSMISDLMRQGLSARQAAAHIAQIDQTAATREGNQLQSETSLRTTGMNNDTSRQTTGMNNDTSRSNNETTNRTALRGQDMDYERAMAPIKLQAKMRQYSADIFKAAGGDNAKAAQMMQAAGLDPKQFLDAQSAQQTAVKSGEDLEAGKAKRAREMFADKYFMTDDKGKQVEDPAARDAAYNAYLNMTDGRALSEEDRLAVEGDAHRHGKLVRGLRQKAQEENDSWWNYTPFSTAKPLPTDVSPELRPEEIGFFGGAFTGHGVKKGDHKLGKGTLPDDIDEDVLKYQLRRNAEFLKQQKK